MYFNKILVIPNASKDNKREEYRIYKAVWNNEPDEIFFRIEGQCKRGKSLFAAGYLSDLIFMMNNAADEVKRFKNEIAYTPNDEVNSYKKYIKEQRKLLYMLKLALKYIQAQEKEAQANV